MAAVVVLIGALGAAIGSFLTVVIHRLPKGESLIRPRSHCPECGALVRARDNIPVVSWLLLRGRCRDCGARISARYPAIELLTAVSFVAIALVRGVDSDLILELPFAAMLIAIAGIDLEHKIVPNRIVAPAAVFGLAGAAVIKPDDLPELLIAGAAAFLALFLAALAYPSGMGMGDVKLAGVMGLFLGSSVAPALLVAFASGTVVGIVVLVREGGSARKKGVPFAPFLALGGLVGVLVGPDLVDFYKDHFLN
ncbi:MAG TPA: prepilin peptidase [Thermoleophilaceae bacterium]|jgi:leader peptidase (prepilin peptidase)/N-methyltransferase